MRSITFFSIDLILPATLGSGVHLHSNINELKNREKKNVFRK
jgi:hypothetical protein